MSVVNTDSSLDMARFAGHLPSDDATHLRVTIEQFEAFVYRNADIISRTPRLTAQQALNEPEGPVFEAALRMIGRGSVCDRVSATSASGVHRTDFADIDGLDMAFIEVIYPKGHWSQFPMRATLRNSRNAQT